MELLTIVDFTQKNPSIDPTAFPNTPAEWFLTSSPYAGSSDCAWAVDFGLGDSGRSEVGDVGRVRCVR
jgi:hypothetical protein